MSSSSHNNTLMRRPQTTSNVAGDDAEYGFVHPPLELRQRRRRRRKLAQVSVMMMVCCCCLVSCLSLLQLCDSFLLKDRAIINTHNTHMLHRHRHRHGRSQSPSLSLRAAVKDKGKIKDNHKKEKTIRTESKRSGYRLGIFPYLFRADTNSTRTNMSSSTSTSTSISTSTPDSRAAQQLTIRENAANSTRPPTAFTADSKLNATAQVWNKDLNSSTTDKSKAILTDSKSSANSTNILKERPELAKSTPFNATNIKSAKAVKVTNTVNDKKDVKAEVQVSWQDKYWNRFTKKPSTSSASASPKPVTSTSSRGGSSASSSSSSSNSKTSPLASSVSQQQVNNRNRTSSSSSNNKKELISTPLVPGKKPSDVLTVEDLESFLMTNGFVKRSELEASQQAMSSAGGAGTGKSKGSANAQTFKPDGTSGSGSVALPQPSVLSYNDLKWGTAVSAGFLGMLVGLSILPNLWFMGTLAGFLYGWDVGKKIPETGTPSNALNNLIVNLGRNLAKTFLTVYDAANAVFFMYKTGELSYAYYKRFSVLDDKFKINAKIDAWNSRFQEGKLSFDAWERENEIGRKALATMRTIWLVEERSLKKSSKRRRQSRYRPIQYVYDAAFWVGRLCRSIMKMLTGGGSSELQEFLKGIRVEISETTMNEISSRFSAAVAALVFVSVTGALYSISPFFLAFIAIMVGVIWPSWVSEFYDRTSRFLDDTRARGRGEEPTSNVFSQLTGRYDKSKFHYYVTMDGKKRYYRTGKPVFSINQTAEERKRKLSKKFPWQSG